MLQEECEKLNINAHARNRIKERCGLPKKAVERSVILALEKGLTHKESKGSLRRYYDYLFLSHGCGANIRLYGNHAYIFTRNTLVTVLPLPNAHKATLKKTMEKRLTQKKRGAASVKMENGTIVSTPDSDAEVVRLEAEIAEMKQRFGIDKQEAFLEAHANISLKEFAAMLHGRDCQPNLTHFEQLLAELRGFVVVYGDSDDRVEFEGAIRAEGYTNPLARDCPAGILVLSENGKLIDDESDLYTECVNKNRNTISVFYCCKDGLTWVFESDIPHETFITFDGGYDEDFVDFDHGFARCIVFEMSALKPLMDDNMSPKT